MCVYPYIHTLMCIHIHTCTLLSVSTVVCVIAVVTIVISLSTCSETRHNATHWRYTHIGIVCVCVLCGVLMESVLVYTCT